MADAPPKEHPGPLVVLVKLHTRPDKIAAAKRALEKITEPTRANPVSLEANMAHGQRDYMAEYMATKNEIFEDISGDFIHELHPPTPAS
jgi:hypothetical protein